MNYLWDTIIKAKQAGVDINEITYQVAKEYSAYMEMSFQDMNILMNPEMDKTVEINPYYRFYSIFKEMFDPDNIEDMAVRNELFDWMIHLIGSIDVNLGMNKQEFFRRFVEADIERGAFGTSVKESFAYFKPLEKEYITNQIVNLYRQNVPINILRKVVNFVFKYSYVYVNNMDKPEILIYAGVKKLEQYIEKMNFILEVFLPLGYEYRIYWDKHFGIIGKTATMRVDSIVLY